jgi:acetyl-CoA acyltransferase
MSRIPIGSPTLGADIHGPGLHERYPDGLVPQGMSAELIADRWGFSRQRLDEFCLASHRKAAQA